MTRRGSDNDCELVKKNLLYLLTSLAARQPTTNTAAIRALFFFVEPRAASSKQEAPSFCARQTETKKNAQHAHALHAPLDMKVCKRH